MGILQKFISRTKTETQVHFEREKNCVYSPLEGEMIPLQAINDGVFSEGMLGKGCGIKPSKEYVLSPFNGEVLMIANTLHALGLKSDDGIELLIHIGMDTVNMNGNGFKPAVQAGDKVKLGQTLMTFSLSEIEQAGYSGTSAVIISNTGDFQDVEVVENNTVKFLDKIMKVNKN